MDYYFIAYLFLCLFVWSTAVVRLFQGNRSISAIIVATLFLFIFILYGTRWFYGSKLANDPNGTWPPIINMCPDYLVYFNWNGADTCIDMSGVNRSGGSFKPWTQDDDFNNPPADASKYFPYVYTAGMTSDQINNLCTQAMAYGLSWEGITNGETCTYYNSNAIAAAAASGSCGATAPPPGSVPFPSPNAQLT